jgi:hypothetical protein
MNAYMSFEWVKLSKRWMPRIILLLLLGAVIVYFWGQGTRVDNQANLFFPRAWLAVLFLSAFCSPFLWPVLGGSWAGNEYGWGTIRMILTRRPHRIQHVLASLSILLIGIGMALVAALVVGSIAGMLVGAATGHGAVISGVLNGSFLATVLETLAAAWFVAAFYLMVAFAAALIFRSAAVGIGIGLGSILAQILLFTIFRGLGGVWTTIAEHFPIIYSQALVQDVAAAGFKPGTALATVNPNDPTIALSIMALGAWMVFMIGASLVAVRTRDVLD